MGTVTLRSAIQETNALAGKQTVYFYIPGSGPFTFSPQTPLPVITDPVSLDATFQHGYSGTPLINIDGTTSGDADGLTVSGGSSLVQGISIKNFSGSGIVLETNGNNTIQKNIISNNVLAGVSVKSGINNSIINNSVYANAGPGIDLWTSSMESAVLLKMIL